MDSYHDGSYARFIPQPPGLSQSGTIPFTTYLQWTLLTYVGELTYSIRRYWRTASVENTATIPTIQASD